MAVTTSVPCDSGHGAAPPASRRRRVEPVEWAALAGVLLPFAVAVIRAWVQDWMPVGDAAYFTVRSRDVFTSHTPLLGAWSSGSSVVGESVNNLGPMQLDVLAPFTHISPYLGTGVGSAVINAACIVVVWHVARSIFGPWRVAVVMAGTTLLIATLGLSWLIDARQQHALVLPFYALLWLSVAMWSGHGFAVPFALAIASLIMQTHFTYAYQTVIVMACALAAYVASVIRRPSERSVKVFVASGAVVAFCWVQPLIDQIGGTGNLGKVLGPARGGQEGAGLDAGVQILAGGALVPPFWLPGSIGSFLQPHDGVSLRGAAFTVVLWALVAAALAIAGRRSRRAVPAAAGAATFVALAAGLVGASLIPVSMFGLPPQNYYWVWSIGAFATIAVIVGAAGLPAVATRVSIARHGAVRVVAVVVLAMVSLGASWPRYPVSAVAFDEVESERIGQPLRAELSRAFSSPGFPGTVEVDLTRAFFGNNYPYVVLTELQRAGIEFRFPAATRNLNRFGESRCATAGELPRVFLIIGRDPRLDPGSEVLAQITGMTVDEQRRFRSLQRHFGDLLRDGTLRVDVDSVQRVLGGAVTKLDAVLATPGQPAADLAVQLDGWRTWGFVDVPASERTAFDEWIDLEHRSVTDFQTLVLMPPGVSDVREPTYMDADGDPTC